VRVPGRYATVQWQIWQRVTGSWVTVTGKRRGDLLICLYDARPAGVILHCAHAASTPRGRWARQVVADPGARSLGSVSPSPAQPCFRRPGRPVVPADRHARRDQRDSADKIEPALAAEPIEKMEATEATEPIEKTDPAEPMHRIEPAEPMDKIDPLDPMLRSEPAEPTDRGEISVFAMPGFSHPLPISGSCGHSPRRPRCIIMQAGQPLAGVEPGTADKGVGMPVMPGRTTSVTERGPGCYQEQGLSATLTGV